MGTLRYHPLVYARRWQKVKQAKQPRVATVALAVVDGGQPWPGRPAASTACLVNFRLALDVLPNFCSVMSSTFCSCWAMRAGRHGLFSGCARTFYGPLHDRSEANTTTGSHLHESQSLDKAVHGTNGTRTRNILRESELRFEPTVRANAVLSDRLCLLRAVHRRQCLQPRRLPARLAMEHPGTC